MVTRFDPEQLLLILGFFVIYFWFVTYAVKFMKERRKEREGDSELTLKLIDEAVASRKKLYAIIDRLNLQKYNHHSSKFPAEMTPIPEEDLKEVVELLSMYNAISAGLVNRTLNKKLVLMFLADDLNNAHAAFAPYLSFIRWQYQNPSMFVSFEYSDDFVEMSVK